MRLIRCLLVLKRWSRARGLCGYLWTWNWPITAPKIRYNRYLLGWFIFVLAQYCFLCFLIGFCCWTKFWSSNQLSCWSQGCWSLPGSFWGTSWSCFARSKCKPFSLCTKMLFSTCMSFLFPFMIFLACILLWWEIIWRFYQGT